jgi:uncharacterized protein YndB with AHSA1/START domain
MSRLPLEIKAAIQIQKQPHEVFEAIVDPAKMSNYFISEGSGRMEEGRRLIWKFPEFDMEVPVDVDLIAPDESVSFYWDVDSKKHRVEIRVAPFGRDASVVMVTENGREADAAGISWLQGNTEGWANFLACMKAYLEYGINLRKGAFDFRFA